MLRGVILGFLLMVLLLWASTVLGETKDGDDRTFSMEAVVVTAERISEYIKNHPQDVEVVRRKEIVEKSLLNVEEVLKTMSGVEVHQSSGVGSRISIRGSGKSSGILILLNGRPLNTNQYGGIDLSTVPVEMIESVTVFKPPVPVWLGPGSTDGAINIVTRDIATGQPGKKGKPTTVTAGIGSFGFMEGGANQVFPVARGTMLAAGAATHRDGKRKNSDRDDGSFSAYWNRVGEGGTRYEVNGRYSLSEFGSPGPIDNPTPDARQRYQKGSLDARLVGFFGETGVYSLNPYGDLVTLKDRSQSGLTSTLDDLKVGVKQETTWSEKSGVWDLRIGGLLERDDLDHTLTGRHHRTMVDLSSQYDQRFGPMTGTIGIRGNYTNDFDFNPGVTGGLGYALSEKTILKGKAGYSVNLPTFGQLYQTSHGSIDQVRGNPDLDKERTWSYDFGIEHRFSKERLVQATFFGAETHDLIMPVRGSDKIYRPANIDRAWRRGIELTLKYGWEMGFTAEINAVFQESRNDDTGEDIPYTPKAKLKASVQYILARFKTRLEVVVRHESSRFSEAENLRDQRLDPYTVMDMKVIQPFSMQGYAGECFVRVNNLFNETYENHFGYPDDGIRVATGIQVRF